MEGKTLIKAIIDVAPRDLVALAVIILFVIVAGAYAAELVDAVKTARAV